MNSTTIFFFISLICIASAKSIEKQQQQQLIDIDMLPESLRSTLEFQEYERALNARKQSMIVVPSKPDSSICFEFEGCFSNSFPFNNTANYLPCHPDDLNTEILLFTRKNRELENAQIVDYRNAHSLDATNFDANKKLKIIIHGFQNNRKSKWLNEMANAILDREDVNVFVVDWGKGALFPLYLNASTNTRLVGRQVGLFVNQIREKYNLDASSSSTSKLNVHCIGHSLGAHTCAYSSNAAWKRFDRITGLDPAGPSFDNADMRARLDPTDAGYVDVIHTNGGSLLSASFGLLTAIGHTDFYVNGGRSQIGCPALTSVLGSLIGGGAVDPTSEIGCSHNRAILYFIESIRSSSSCKFVAYLCEKETLFDKGECLACENNNTCTQMGYDSDKFSGRGSFYLATNSYSPYCGLHHFFEMKINTQSSKTAGEIQLFIGKNLSISLTGASDDLKSGELIRKVLAIEHDLAQLDSQVVALKFNKKGKPFFGKDPNSSKFNFDTIKLTNVELNKTFSTCEIQTIEDKQTLTLSLSEQICSAEKSSLLKILY